jgi:hypothetical protein
MNIVHQRKTTLPSSQSGTSYNSLYLLPVTGSSSAVCAD